MMTTPNYLVLSTLGPDRPGLVADVTDYITSRGGNVEESRMMVLGAEFGMLVLVSGTEEVVAKIAKDALDLGTKIGAGVLTRRTKSPEEHRRGVGIPCSVKAEALDHEGIVRAVALAISKLGINIVSLETTAYNAPITGSPLFRLEARVDVPQGVPMAQLRKTMVEVGQRENLDIEVKTLIASG